MRIKPLVSFYYGAECEEKLTKAIEVANHLLPCRQMIDLIEHKLLPSDWSKKIVDDLFTEEEKQKEYDELHNAYDKSVKAISELIASCIAHH